MDEGFKRQLALETLPVTVATTIAHLPEADQQALLRRLEEDPKNFNQGTVMTYVREKRKAERDERDEDGAELVIGEEFVEEITRRANAMSAALSRADRKIQKNRSAKLLRLQAQILQRLEEMQDIIDLGVIK